MHTCGLKVDGGVECWGANTQGQPAGYGQARVSAGDFHTCSINANGSAVCWGADDSGQASAPTGEFIQVAAGREHTCAIRPGGNVDCWGRNTHGQATDQTPDPDPEPDPDSELPFRFTQLSAGNEHTCGLKANGSIDCWGNPADGRTSGQSGAYTQVSAGRAHTCGLRPDGSIDCWGNNAYGQAADGTGAYTQVSAAAFHTCALRYNGSVDCWGWNDSGRAEDRAGPYIQLSGQNDYTCGLQPGGGVECWGAAEAALLSPPEARFAHISAAAQHACGVKVDGTLECWGSDDYLQAPRLALAPASLPRGIPGQSYTRQLTASGGTAPYIYTLVDDSSLPPGLTLSADGTLSGTPAALGSYTFAVQATDSRPGLHISHQQTYTLHISYNATPSVQAGSDAAIAEGQAFTLLATFTDVDLLNTHTASVDWGDGSPPEPVAVSEAGGSGSLGASHTYAFGTGGSHTVRVTVTDSSGEPNASGAGSLAVSVAEVANRWYVSAAAAGSACSAWDSACPSLQTALAKAGPGDEVWVAGGAYQPGAAGQRSRSFVLERGVALHGGFAGTEAGLAARPAAGAAPSVLSGDLDGSGGCTALDAYHVVTAGPAVDATTLLEGFTITGGCADGSGADGQGGGLYLQGAAPSLQNLVVRRNRAVSGGGAYSTGGSPRLENLLFAGNWAGDGGGLYLSNGSPILTNLTLYANHAESCGGGLWAGPGAAPLLTNLLAWANTAGSAGAQLYRSGGNVSIAYSLVQDAFPAGEWDAALGVDAGGNLAADPFLVDGAGADTLPGSADDDLRPAYNSPAIDAGGPAGCPGADLRRLPRADWRCDIGAYEVQLSDTPYVERGGMQPGVLYTFGPTLVKTQFAVLGDLDRLRVTRFDTSHPDAIAALESGRYWNIAAYNASGAAASGFSTSLALPKRTPVTGGDQLCRWNGTAWHCRAGSLDAAENTITLAAVTDFSDWALGNGGPTAVTLAGLSLQPAADGIRLAWSTAQELNLVGFRLYRSPAPGAPRRLLAPELIPAAAAGSLEGRDYTYLDATARRGETYAYWLELVLVNGSQWHGPVTTPSTGWLYLPVVRR